MMSYSCIFLLVFITGNCLQDCKTKNSDSIVFTTICDICVKLIISFQVLIISLNHDEILDMRGGNNFWPVWIFFIFLFVFGLAVNFMFFSKVFSYCCVKSDEEISKKIYFLNFDSKMYLVAVLFVVCFAIDCLLVIGLLLIFNL